MEVLFEQKQWHHVDLRTIPGVGADDVAGMDFYKQYYQKLLQSDSADKIATSWLETKRRTADWLEKHFLAPLKNKPGEPARLLSLGAGLGIIEEIWLKQGYHVDVQECQGVSLEQLKKHYPDCTLFIGDACHLPCPDSRYDMVGMIALDYVFNREKYGDLMREVRRVLRPGGILVSICVSNLTPKSLVAAGVQRVKKFLGGFAGQKTQEAVRWGWMRTFSEHLRMAAQQGLQLESAFYWDTVADAFRPLNTHKSLWRLGWLNTTTITFQWRKKNDDR